MIITALLTLWALLMGWPIHWRVARIPAPIPDWLRNDPELEALAVMMCETWRRDYPSVVNLWTGGRYVQMAGRAKRYSK